MSAPTTDGKPTMMDVGKLNEENLGVTRTLLQRLERLRNQLTGMETARPASVATPTPPGLVQAFLEDAETERAMLQACGTELRAIEHALCTPQPDRPEPDAAIGGPSEGRAMSARPLGGRYA